MKRKRNTQTEFSRVLTKKNPVLVPFSKACLGPYLAFSMAPVQNPALILFHGSSCNINHLLNYTNQSYPSVDINMIHLFKIQNVAVTYAVILYLSSES